MKKLDQTIIEWDFSGTGRLVTSKRNDNQNILSLLIKSNINHAFEPQRRGVRYSSGEIILTNGREGYTAFNPSLLCSQAFLDQNQITGCDFWLERNESFIAGALRIARLLLKEIEVKFNADMLPGSKTFEHLLSAFTVRQHTWVKYRGDIVPIEIFLREKHNLPPPRACDRHDFNWGRRGAAEDIY